MRVTSWYQTGPIETTIFPLSAIEYGLQSFIKFSLESGWDMNFKKSGQSLLFKAVVAQDAQMVKLLLRHGVDHNGGAPGSTPWHTVVDEVLKLANGSGHTGNWANIAQDFLEHKADPTVTIQKKSIQLIIRSTFMQWNPKRTSDILTILSQSAKSNESPKRFSFLLLGKLNIRSRVHRQQSHF